MNKEGFPAAEYEAYTAELTNQLKQLKTKKDRVSWSRLAVVLLLIAAVYYLQGVNVPVMLATGALSLTVFIRLIVIAANNSRAISNAQRLIDINQQELQIAAGAYTRLPDGSGFLYPGHSYANDLDIFGRASIYQYMNRTQSAQGRVRLAEWLLEPAGTEQVTERQLAAKELGAQYKWRQQLQAYGLEDPISLATETKVADWIKEENLFISQPGWKLLRWLYPVVSISFVLLFAVDFISVKVFSIAYVAALALSSLVGKLVLPAYSTLNKIVPQANTLFNSAQWIEKNPFKNNYLRQLQNNFIHGNQRASLIIRQLKNILDKFDYNLNLALVLFLNPLLLWNLQLVFQLEKWRVANKENARNWFHALGEMEAICSVAALHFNHPDWCFPIIDTARQGVFISRQMGHPLIPAAKMVYNDFQTTGTPQIALITGSNMAGKSTFLRSTGVNIVLAMMGAPVCAAFMELSPMRVISSMRVADNLEESTSTFYAELKKLKSIIESVNNREKVFVLLDEILRGTNSLDRHTGTQALIKQLVNRGAVALLATHDVALSELQEAHPDSIHNYHFDARIAGEELYFDYQLKEGICTSINASLLMKKIGIEL